MPFQVSPGVNVSEIDLTTIVPAVSTSIGVIAGRFNWGPVSKRVLVNNEDVLAANFGKPDNNTYEQWFTAANFLSYSNQLYVTRANNTANNATSKSGVDAYIPNEDVYEDLYETSGVTARTVGTNESNTVNWVAKYPGELGNSLKVAVCQSTNTYESTPVRQFEFEPDSVSVTATGGNVAGIISPGDLLYLANSTVNIDVKVVSLTSTSDTSILTLEEAPTEFNLGGTANVTTTDSTLKRRWEYYNFFDGAPGTSNFAETQGGANDEMHVAVIDEDGFISGTKNTVIERYSFVSKASDAKLENGATNYYKTVINNQSPWIWWGEHETAFGFSSSTVNELSSKSFVVSDESTATSSYSMTNGTNGEDMTAANYINAYDLYSDPEQIDVSILISGAPSTTTAGGTGSSVVVKHMIQNIAEKRKDCVVVLSPEYGDVVNNNLFAGAEAEDIVAYRNNDLILSSSYGIMDSGWKYQYDKYNDTFRYIPLNGDLAGTMARTDNIRDPWYSPAGLNRGSIKNVVKLAYNPPKAQRDELYKAGVNPIVSFPGEGTILFGDKTMLSRPSAFDRINVRRLFIVLEKAIATAAKFTLFEFNDAFTRAQFRNLVEPFLRDVQGRRGIFDFRVVCDETNNTPEVIDRNEFVGDIYIKPARSINFIQLNFIAVRTGVDFEEVVGNFG